MKKQGTILVALTIVMAALSFGAWAVSKDVIIENRQAALTAAMEAVLPGQTDFVAEEFEDDDGIIQGVWKAGDRYAIETVAYGYHDNVRLMVGVAADGKVVGLQVLELHETPGLGQQAKTDRIFLSQFLNTSADAALDENVDALSGATVTTKAFIKAVNAAAGYVTGADVSSGATEWGG